MSYEVSVADGAARPTAVIAATTTWREFPALWGQPLDEVWGGLRAGGIGRGCRNVMLYLDDVPRVEVGVELPQPCDAMAGSARPRRATTQPGCRSPEGSWRRPCRPDRRR